MFDRGGQERPMPRVLSGDEHSAYGRVLAIACAPRRSRNCDKYRLVGWTRRPAETHRPSPAYSSARHPMAQFRAVGGFSQAIRLARQFQNTRLAPVQPWPVPELLRFIALRSFPRMRTLSYNVPVLQRQCGPLSEWAFSASHARKTFGPGVCPSRCTKSCRPRRARQRCTRHNCPDNANE